MTTLRRIITLASTLALTSTVFAAADDNSDMFYNHFPTMTTSPLLGAESAFDGSDLLYNYSSINHDLLLLFTHQDYNDYMTSQKAANTRPIIIVSGGIEGDLVAAGQFHDSTQYSTALATAEVDIAAFINSWATTFMSIDYQNVPVEQGSREPQDQVYLNRGYATIGDLNKYPIYGSIGKMYAPFGRYNSAMVTTPETESLARILDTSAVLGYFNNGLYGQAFTYNTYQSNHNNMTNEGGAGVGYKKTDGNHPFQIGASYITNIADSEGMRDNGAASGFEGFNVDQHDLSHDVPAYDVYGSVGFNAFTLIGEYISATESFDANDLSYNGTGAKPRALQAELDYTMTVQSKPTTLAFMYSQTWESLALNLPEKSYNFTASTSIWRDTIESVEYSYNQNYSSGDTSTGAGSAGPTSGGNSNVITVQLGVYF